MVVNGWMLEVRVDVDRAGKYCWTGWMVVSGVDR